MADTQGDAQIVIGIDIANSLKLMQAQLKQLQQNLSILITGKLDMGKTRTQLRSDIKSLKLNQDINLTAKVDKNKAKKQIDADLKTISEQTLKLGAQIDIDKIKQQLADANINLNAQVSGGKELQNVGNSLDSINKKSAATVASIGLLHTAFRELQRISRQMIETAVELDTQLTNLRMVTGQSYDDVSRMVDGYTALAKEIGATTTQVAEAADEWLRQGYTMAETEQLIAQSMVLSKVGAIDSAEATKDLTSALKGYQLQVDEVASVVDKLTAIDLKAAVSSGDLATAMSRTATSANMAGVSMDTLLGYLAVVQ